MNSKSVFKTAQGLRGEGRAGEALALLRDALRRGALDPEGIYRAGRFIHEAHSRGEVEGGALPALLLGQCTTSWLATALTAAAWARGIPLHVVEGDYDNVMQGLSAAALAEGVRPEVVVLIPWTQRLLGGEGRSDDQRVEDELSVWRQAWDAVTRRLGARLVQAGYDWVTPGAQGHHLGGTPGGDVHLIRRANAALRESLPAGAFFVDLEQVSGAIGRGVFYDARRYHWTKQPFSEKGVCLLAEHLAAAVRALTTGPKKVLAVDLDNTLWGGVVGETGPLEITLGSGPDGEAYRAFQRHLKDLSRRGCLLAVCSKNNPDDAREPFEKNPEMVLALADFAAFDASWDPKSAALRRIAEELNLGLDSFVFFDDSPAEREHVRQALPEVEVVEVPEDPAEFVRALQAGLWFETATLTEADASRADQYRQRTRRRESQRQFASMDHYLRSLEMMGDVRDVDEPDMPRVVQLLAKTNQFNLTTRRHTGEDVRRLMAQPDALALTLRVSDRFGDHGLVSILIGVPLPGARVKTLRIDTWLMSCRVIGRSVEQFFFGALVRRVREHGYRRLIGEHIPTKKNAVVSALYEQIGFERIEEAEGGARRFALDLERARIPVTFLEPAG